MNNAGFCILRYFRDLGADAHLLLYSNDGQDSLSHFKPECDTWEIERWATFIRQTEIPNTVFSGLPPPLSGLVSLRSYLKSRLGSQVDYVASASKEIIKKTYTGYDKYIGNGIAPAMFSKAGLVLDIFYPYSWIQPGYVQNWNYGQAAIMWFSNFGNDRTWWIILYNIKKSNASLSPS